MTTQQKKSSTRQGFKTGESIVYPAHGVGQIVAIEEQEVAGMKLELFVIDFEKDKMRLKVPVAAPEVRQLTPPDFPPSGQAHEPPAACRNEARSPHSSRLSTGRSS